MDIGNLWTFKDIHFSFEMEHYNWQTFRDSSSSGNLIYNLPVTQLFIELEKHKGWGFVNI